MEWFFGLAAAFGFFWWLGRPDASGRTSPLADEVARRATDMNDPDGTFMDGYVAGRLTEPAEVRETVEQQRLHIDALESERESYVAALGDECADDWELHEHAHDEHDDLDGDLHDDLHDDDW